jgi:hypothetical protein
VTGIRRRFQKENNGAVGRIPRIHRCFSTRYDDGKGTARRLRDARANSLLTAKSEMASIAIVLVPRRKPGRKEGTR